MERTGIFQLTEKDRQAHCEHLLRLTPSDRRTRFFCTANDSFIQRHCASVPMNWVYGYFVAERLVASAILAPEDEGLVEFSVAVDEAYRGFGMAKSLLDHCMHSLRGERASKLVIRHMSENHAMAGVYRHYAGERRHRGGETCAILDLAGRRREERNAMELLCGGI
jgi:GNAT superfamily N-acetyltransferase